MHSKGWNTSQLVSTVSKNEQVRRRDGKQEGPKKEDHLVDCATVVQHLCSSNSFRRATKTQAQFMKEFMEMMNKRNLEIPDRLQKLLPDGRRTQSKSNRRS